MHWQNIVEFQSTQDVKDGSGLFSVDCPNQTDFFCGSTCFLRDMFLFCVFNCLILFVSKNAQPFKLEMNPKTGKLIAFNHILYIHSPPNLWNHTNLNSKLCSCFLTSQFLKPKRFQVTWFFQTNALKNNLKAMSLLKMRVSLKFSKCPKMPWKETRADHFRTLV